MLQSPCIHHTKHVPLPCPGEAATVACRLWTCSARHVSTKASAMQEMSSGGYGVGAKVGNRLVSTLVRMRR
eukprot:925207-Alexandrium_andersonii.AAC.1